MVNSRLPIMVPEKLNPDPLAPFCLELWSGVSRALFLVVTSSQESTQDRARLRDEAPGGSESEREEQVVVLTSKSLKRPGVRA